MARKHKKVHPLKIITQYGIHVWAILIIANAVLVYAFQFSTHAANKPVQPADILPVVSGDPNSQLPNVSKVPAGPVLNLTFTVPGIGSGGGTMTPKHLKRNVTVFLFSQDENSLNPTVKPLYSIKGYAYYDINTSSPTYTSFLNPNFDVGSDVKEGDYQIAFRTDQSLRTVIKESPDKVGGKIFGLAKNNQSLPIPLQTVLMGDTLPKTGDNTVDVSDYNAFVNCFGNRNNSTFCKGGNYGDFDDNGVIDGIDYNILLHTFSALLKQGQAIPQISVVPTGSGRISRLAGPTPTGTSTKKATTAPKPPTKTSQTASSSGGSAIGGILFFIFILILGAIGFILFKKNEKVRAMILKFISRTPPATPPAPGTDLTEATTEVAPEAAPPATPEAPATEAAPADALATPVETPAEPQPTPAPVAGGDEAKDYYVKKKGPDEAGTGFWLTLTDDNGPVEAHYTASDVTEGFSKVKGTMKTENGKTYLEISELTTEG